LQIHINYSIKEKSFNPEVYQYGEIKKMLFDYLFLEWLKQKKQELDNNELSYGTYKAYESYYYHHLSPLFLHDIRDIGFAELEEFKDNLSKTIKLKTKRNILNCIHSFFSWLLKKGRVDKIPVFPTIEGNDATPMKALDRVSLKQSLELIPEKHRDIIEFAFETGVRIGELCSIKVLDVNTIERTVLIQRTYVNNNEIKERPKGKRKETVLLSDRALEITEKNMQDKTPGAFLFINPGTGKGYNPNYIRKQWKKSTGLDISFHEAGRHTFCSLIGQDKDINAYDVMRLARHSDIRTTQRYMHQDKDKMINALNRRAIFQNSEKQKFQNSNGIVTSFKKVSS
jgi:integrase